MTDRSARASDDKEKSSAKQEGGFSFGSVMGHLGRAKDAVVEGGSKAINKTTELVKENAPKVKDVVVENAPKVKHAVVEAANSKAGKAVVGAGKEIYEEEKATGKRVAGAVQRGDVATAAREVAPLVIMGPQGVILDKVGRKALDKGVQELPKEHQGTARDVVNLGKMANGGLPDAKHVITGVVLDGDKRGKAMEAASGAGDAVVGAGKKVWGWMKGGDNDAEAKVEQKPAGKKSEKIDYPDEPQPKDLPKRQATKK